MQFNIHGLLWRNFRNRRHKFFKRVKVKEDGMWVRVMFRNWIYQLAERDQVNKIGKR